MGIHASASIHFGVLIDSDYIYEHYDPDGACLEEDSEWQEYEFPSEAMEVHFHRLCEWTNLTLLRVGSYEDEENPWLLALAEPTARGDETGAAEFDPRLLDAGLPSEHLFAQDVAKKAGLDWLKASWHLCWSLG